MWLPWKSAKEVANMLYERKKKNMMPEIPLWANLCNSLTTKPEEKIDEFKEEMKLLYDFVDYFEINVSCPNQEWVCGLQSELDEILKELTKYNEELASTKWVNRKKLFVKISPLTQNEDSPEDWTIAWLKSIAEICNKYKDKWLDAVIATNTAKEHKYKEKTKIKTPNGGIITGWASWKQIQKVSLKSVNELRKILDSNIPIIWVGWIWCDEKWEEWQSAINMLSSWAISVQLLTSFVKKGTIMVVRDLKKALIK
jgi:dihydroorotate dehydrogenase